MTPVAATSARPGRLRPVPRKLLLALHVFVSVSWSGVACGQLVLAVTAATDRPLRHPAYEFMHVFDLALNIPFALLTLTTGLVVSVKTRWGLFRHWWVTAKFVLTTGAILFAAAVMRTLIGRADQGSAGAGPGRGIPAMSIVLGASLLNLVFVATVLLSILKPWGRTARGRGAARTLRPGRDAAPAPRPDPARLPGSARLPDSGPGSGRARHRVRTETPRTSPDRRAILTNTFPPR